MNYFVYVVIKSFFPCRSLKSLSTSFDETSFIFGTILCFWQKLIQSWVSGVPPTRLPAMLNFFIIHQNTQICRFCCCLHVYSIWILLFNLSLRLSEPEYPPKVHPVLVLRILYHTITGPSHSFRTKLLLAIFTSQFRQVSDV